MDRLELWIPEGTYYYELTEQFDSSLVPFKFSKPENILRVMNETLTNADLAENFDRARDLATILFGNKPLPPDVYTYAEYIERMLIEQLERGARGDGDCMIPQMLNKYKAVKDLGIILARNSSSHPPRSRLSRSLVSALDRWIKDPP